MEDKYYTPEIEEFCVGFEYRICDIDTAQYANCVFKDGESAQNLLDGDYGEVDVKYLSAEDIVDLGFVKTKEEPNKFDFILGTKYTLDNYNLYLSNVTGRVIITVNDLTMAYSYDEDPKEYTLFNGKIKNKSKLKEVLQMVGVL